MRLAFVSDCSPRRGNIWGLRVSSFARGLASRGHHVLLLSPAEVAGDSDLAPAGLPAMLARHDWGAPLHVTAAPDMSGLLSVSKRAPLPGVLRRAVTGYMMLREGGVHPEWVRGSRPLATAIAASFKPEMVWSIFGNSSTLVVAQRIARLAGARWMMDIKDNWESYVPAAARASLARRFADAAGYTTNAELHGDIAARWLGRKGQVVYSGVADVMAAPADARARDDVFLLTLIGSTYRPDKLAGFLGALGTWLDRLRTDERARVKLRYCGSGVEMVQEALRRHPLSCPVDVAGNVPHDELARICQGAMANSYIWAPFTFHHKMLELLSTRRPAISFPGEHDESIRLAARVGGELNACRSETELMEAFDGLWRRWRGGDLAAGEVDVSAFSWDAGAAKLEAIFESALEGARNQGHRRSA